MKVTRENLAAAWPILEALGDGKAIQYKSMCMDKWMGLDLNQIHFPNLVESPENYRVKPEPRELWAVVGVSEKLREAAIFDTEQEAIAFAKRHDYKPPFKFREVIE